MAQPPAKKPRVDFWVRRHQAYAESWNNFDMDLIASNYAPRDVVGLHNGREVARTLGQMLGFLVKLRSDTHTRRLEFVNVTSDDEPNGLVVVTARFTLGGVTGGSKKTWQCNDNWWFIICDDVTYLESIPPAVPQSVVDQKMVEFAKHWNDDNFAALGNLYAPDGLLVLDGQMVARSSVGIGNYLSGLHKNKGMINFRIEWPCLIRGDIVHYDIVTANSNVRAHRKMTWGSVGGDWKILLENANTVPGLPSTR